MAKRLQKALLLLAVAAMLPASLYGCTGDTGASPSDPPAANTDELPQEKNSVTVGIAQDLDTLDPHKAASAGVSEVLFNLYEGLVKVNAEGGVSGAVASDYTISEDKTVYTFTLREGVTFHNGAPVTMDDVLYSLKRCAGSENDGVPLISAFSDVTDISAVDDTHVAVTLSKPSLEFLYSMTAAIIPQGSGDTIATNPVGTGPFAFQSYTPQESLVAKRYDGYWGTPAYLEEVTFRIISSAETMVMSLKSGVLDMVIHLPNTMAAEVKEGFTVHEDTMKLVQALYLNNAVKPLDDVRVRQAMYYAIDVNEIIEFVCNGAGVATGTSMYPAHTKYFLPELATAYQKNLDKARELLAQAGYPDGFALTITVPGNYEQHVQTAQVLEQQLGQVGIQVTIQTVEWESWVSDVYRGREYMATVCGIAADDMTAREMLVRYVSDGRKNFINFNDPDYDKAVARAIASTDDQAQTECYLEAERILNEQAASLWIQDLCDLVVMRPELEGFTFYRTYVLDMSTIRYQ